MRRLNTALFFSAAWTIAIPASGQRLLDLQVRTSAGADALAAGAAGVFWNPGAITGFEGRAEALVVDVRGSAATGLDGLALATAYRLDERTTFAAGYQHVGLEEIGRTSTSPLRDPGTEDIDIGEHVFGAALARALGEALTFGAVVRYARTAEITGGDGVIEFGAGVLYRRTDLPLQPRIGAAVRAEDDGTNWTAGVDIAPPITIGEWRLLASYGAGGSPQVDGITHRIAAVVDWRDRVLVSAGLAGEPDGPGRSWQPLASASLRVSRFAIGVLREELPNDFGAIHSLRFSIVFD